MAQPVTAASGWRWFLEGVRALRMQPLALTGIVVFYILISGLLSSMPFIGTMAAAVWMPFGAVLVGFAARDTLAGRTPVYGTFIAAFRKPGMRLRLIGVGLISAACMEVIMLIFQLLSKASIAQWDISEKGISLSSVADNLPVTGLVVSVALYVPLLMATLFASSSRTPARASARASFIPSSAFSGTSPPASRRARSSWASRRSRALRSTRSSSRSGSAARSRMRPRSS